MIELILGGAKSGKTAHALECAVNTGLPVTYVATATSGDEEMADRIANHKAERPDHWGLIEEPVRLAQIVDIHAVLGQCIIIDCLTLWFTNLLFNDDGDLFARQTEAFLLAMENSKGHIIMVSNETGLGIVPVNKMSRQFCDAAGLMHQRLASISTRVRMVIAGLPLELKKNTENCAKRLI